MVKTEKYKKIINKRNKERYAADSEYRKKIKEHRMKYRKKFMEESKKQGKEFKDWFYG